MKTINKIMSLGLLSTMALFFSCSNEVEYNPADPASSVIGVQFVESSKSVELDPADPTEYTIALTRPTTSGALTVPMTVISNTDDVFTVGDATFADGSSDGECKVTFNKAEIGTNYKLKIAIKDAAAVNEYSDSVLYDLSITRVKWNDVGYYVDDNGQKVEGYALYTEDFITTFWGVENLTFPTKLQERDDQPGYFRMVNTYGANYAYNEEGDWDADNDYYIYIDATNPKKVYIPHYCQTGMDWGYGNIRVSSMAGYYLAKGDAATAANYYGTYANGKITFPTDGLLISLPSYGTGGFYTANGSGAFKLVIDPSKDLYEANIDDDFEFSQYNDYDLTSEKLNTVTNGINVLKGKCVTTTDKCDERYAAAYGTPYKVESPYAEGYDLIFNVTDEGKVLVTSDYTSQPIGITAMGEAVYAQINAKNSTFSENNIVLNITFTNKSGDVVYGTTDETLEHATWTAVATGTYTYAQFWEGDDEGLVLYQKDQDKTQYKIPNWGGGIDFQFSMDSDGSILVTDQFTGYTHSSYGDVWVDDLVDYTGGTSMGTSSYADGVYTFNVIYYVSAGYFGYGEETFTVTSTNAAKVAKAKAKAAKKSSPKVKKTTVKNNVKKSSKFVGKKVSKKTITKNAKCVAAQ